MPRADASRGTQAAIGRDTRCDRRVRAIRSFCSISGRRARCEARKQLAARTPQWQVPASAQHMAAVASPTDRPC